MLSKRGNRERINLQRKQNTSGNLGEIVEQHVSSQIKSAHSKFYSHNVIFQTVTYIFHFFRKMIDLEPFEQ